jgi:hypothetical protein
MAWLSQNIIVCSGYVEIWCLSHDSFLAFTVIDEEVNQILWAIYCV